MKFNKKNRFLVWFLFYFFKFCYFINMIGTAEFCSATHMCYDPKTVKQFSYLYSLPQMPCLLCACIHSYEQLSGSYCICVFSACCPLPTENHSSTHPQWAHTWWCQAEHCCLNREEPLPRRGTLSCFKSPASGFTRNWCRNIPPQGQDPLAAWGGGSRRSHSPSILSGQELKH